MKISQDGKQWEGAKQNYSKSSPFFVADCGLCGTDMQEEVKTRPSIPIIPIRENMKRNLYISPLRASSFFAPIFRPFERCPGRFFV